MERVIVNKKQKNISYKNNEKSSKISLVIPESFFSKLSEIKSERDFICQKVFPSAEISFNSLFL